jgi:hypothetical protein
MILHTASSILYKNSTGAGYGLDNCGLIPSKSREFSLQHQFKPLGIHPLLYPIAAASFFLEKHGYSLKLTTPPNTNMAAITFVIMLFCLSTFHRK